tara:strand:- start:791 stop:1237 length:447 start_codon:yes stop_codon:yes gene_type:complete
MNYLYRAFIVALIWGVLMTCDAYLGIKHFRTGMFLKMTTYGFSILIIYFFIKKELHLELHDLWKNDRMFLITYIIFLLFASGLVNYLYYSSHHESKGHSHIVLPITMILPVALSTLGTWFILKEDINRSSLFGIFLMFAGAFVLVKNN